MCTLACLLGLVRRKQGQQCLPAVPTRVFVTHTLCVLVTHTCRTQYLRLLSIATELSPQACLCPKCTALLIAAGTPLQVLHMRVSAGVLTRLYVHLIGTPT